MTQNNNNDLEIVGKIASAISQEGWNQLVATACDTFEKFVAPITEITYGIGRLAQAKFDGLVDVQKVLAADNVSKAQQKVSKSKKPRKAPPKAPILIIAIEESSIQTDETIRQLWANLLAQELVSGDVHPEFTRILSRLSANDAQLLVAIAQRNSTLDFKKILEGVLKVVAGMKIDNEKPTFHHDLLEQLNLIRYSEAGEWRLTRTGGSFLRAVSDPSFE